MRIRRKLLVLLLAISLLPLLIVGLYDFRNARNLALRLTSRGNEIVINRFSSQLRQLTRQSAAIIHQQKGLVELSLKIQALEAERYLAAPPPLSPRVYFDHRYDSGENPPPGIMPSPKHLRTNKDSPSSPLSVSYGEQVIRLAPGVAAKSAGKDIARLSRMTATYRDLYKAHSDLFYWQYTSLETGVHSSYPGHGGYPATYDARNRPWYRNAKSAGKLVWTPPYVDASTRKLTMTASMPIRRPDRSFAGVTAIDVEILSVLRKIRARSALSENVQTFLTGLHPRGKAGEKGIRIIAHRSYLTQNSDWETDLKLDWLKSGDGERMNKLLADMGRGGSGLVRMPFGGRDSFWAYEAIDNLGNYLFFVVPFENVTAQFSQLETIVQFETWNRMALAAIMSLLMISLVAAVAVFSSRTVTAPIDELAAAAQRVAAGDFKTRVDIRTRDEMGELGEAFNAMVPQLEDRIQMHHSMSMAREVQQSLLPAEAPRFPGFDIAGHSTYSDATGGDYYDFIDLSGLEKNCLGIAVGDVSGHGIAPALLMATARALLRNQVTRPGRIAKHIGDINRQLVPDTRHGRFMTMFYLVIECETREVHWVNAGHDAAILYNPAAGTFKEIKAADIPLGIRPDWTYREFSLEGGFEGQILLIGTDGIWDTRNAEGEMFGKEAACAIVRDYASQSAADICAAISDTLAAFRGEGVQTDDMTMVVVKG